MANTRTLTSANSIITIGVVGLFDVAQRLQGFSADDITDLGDIEPIESSMGIDGRLSAGFVPVSTKQNINLQADSESNDMFEDWFSAEQQAREKYVAFGLLLLPAVSRKYTLTRGFLRSLPPSPSLGRTLKPRRYTIEWQTVTSAPY